MNCQRKVRTYVPGRIANIVHCDTLAMVVVVMIDRTVDDHGSRLKGSTALLHCAGTDGFLLCQVRSLDDKV